MEGPEGLDYASVFQVAGILGICVDEGMLHMIRALERNYLRMVHKVKSPEDEFCRACRKAKKDHCETCSKEITVEEKSYGRK